MFTNVGRGRWDSFVGGVRAGGPMNVQVETVGQLPFYRSMTDLMNAYAEVPGPTFFAFSKLIVDTEIEGGHEEMLAALDGLADRSGIDFDSSPAYVAATRKLQEGMVEADDDFDTTVDPILDEDDPRGND